MQRHPEPGRARPARRGVWLFPGAPAAALADAVVAAEEAGLDEVWIADEGVAREPVAVLAAASGRTATIRLGVGITSPLLRHPAAIAASMATLDELSDGRAVLGLGVGGHLSLDPVGITAERPVGVVADAIRVARGVFGAEPVARGQARYTPPDHALPPRDVPIWVGARGPQLTRLAAREADGLFLSGCTPEEIQRIVPDVRAVQPDVEVALYHSAGDGDDRSSVSTWAQVGESLTGLASAWVPASIGINLVDLARPGADPVALVGRAAAVLAAS